MPNTSFPTSNNGLADFADAFSETIREKPSDFGLTVDEASAYEVTRLAYVAALRGSKDKKFNSSSAYEDKREAQTRLISETRRLVNQAQAFPGMTDAKRVRLGLRPRDVKPTPAPVPTNKPLVEIVGTVGEVFVVRVRPGGSDNNFRRKPRGVRQVLLYTYEGTQPPANRADWRLRELSGKSEITFALPPGTAPGTFVWVTACWVNSRNESGPFGVPACRRVGYDDVFGVVASVTMPDGTQSPPDTGLRMAS